MTQTARPASAVPAANDTAAAADYLRGTHHDEWQALIGYAIEVISAHDEDASAEWRAIVAAEFAGAAAMFARFTGLDRGAVKAYARYKAVTSQDEQA